MNPKIYQMLNEVENDNVHYENASLTETEAKNIYQNIKKRMYKRKRYKGAAVAACCTLCLGTALLAGPFQGEVKAAVQNVTSYIGNMLGLKEDIKPYEQVVGKSVTENGITLTLNSVVLDKDSLVVSLLEIHKEAMKEELPMYHSLPGSVKVNGKEVYAGGNGTGQQVDAYTMENLFAFNLEGIDTSRLLDIELQFLPAEKSGNGWEFAFQADGKKLSKDTINIPLEQSFTLTDRTEIMLNELTRNAMGAKIYYTSQHANLDTDIVLEGTDDLGNEVSFYLASGTEEGGTFKLDDGIGNLDKAATKLTLTPYEISYNGQQEEVRVQEEISVEQEAADTHNKEMIESGISSSQAVQKTPVGEAFAILLK